MLNTFIAVILWHLVILHHQNFLQGSHFHLSIIIAPFHRSQTPGKVMAGIGSCGWHSRITCLPSFCIAQKILLLHNYIMLLLRGMIFKYLFILVGILSSPTNFIACAYFNKISTYDMRRKILGIFPEWEIEWAKGILLFLKQNLPQVPEIRNTIAILGWISHLPSDNDLFFTVFCAAKF